MDGTVNIHKVFRCRLATHITFLVFAGTDNFVNGQGWNRWTPYHKFYRFIRKRELLTPKVSTRITG